VSLRARVAMVCGLAVFVALLAAALVVYPIADRDLHDELDSSLVTTASNAPQFAQRLKQQTLEDGGAQTVGVLTIGDTLLQFVAVDALDQPDPSTGLGPLTDVDAQVADGGLAPYFSSTTYQGRAYRMYTAFSTKPGLLVRVARPESVVLGPLQRLGFILAALVLGGALAVAFGARLLAGRVLRPVRALTETVEHVTATQDLALDLKGRVDTRGRDEIARLARSFAAMMAALDDSVQTQRRLVADASHELRTPLTSLTTNLELLAEEGGLADPQAPALLGSAREQSVELRVLINDLVDLARYGRAETHREDVRLDLLAAAVVERAARRAPHVRFESRLDECFVYADPDAIERAIGNLVDNALKWSPPEGAVRITVSVGAREAVFGITDEGPGIPATDLPHIFDRFYRSPSARSKPGSGLGLSIVRQIADTHGGRVVAQPRPRGTEMLLTLPCAGDR
jgi:two-component system, OmpR family, sensor histidine kinase MprB